MGSTRDLDLVHFYPNDCHTADDILPVFPEVMKDFLPFGCSLPKDIISIVGIDRYLSYDGVPGK